MSTTKLSRLLLIGVVAAGLGLPGRASASGSHAPVVGGQPAPAGKWPDTAAVTDGTFAFCTGTLVGPQVVVTAGHCVEGSDVAEVKLDAIDSEGPGEVIPVIQAVAFPDWEFTYDIAVLTLAQPSTIAPRPLATECVVTESLIDNAPVTLVGYGATTPEGNDFNTTLMEGEARILDSDCTGGDGCAPAVSPGGEFVAGGDGVDSCFGDSGGPVYLSSPHGIVLAGVVSRGIDSSPTPCGGGGIYVRPDSLLDWIEETAGQPIVRAVCAPPPPPDPPPDPDDGSDDDGTDDGDGDDPVTDDDGAAPDPDDDTGDPASDLPEAPSLVGGCSAASESGNGLAALALLALALILTRKLSSR
jgi:uncharacterized protein (TIGR03382 family)